MDVKTTLVRLTPERYRWLRREAFNRGIPQSTLISQLLDKERRRIDRAIARGSRHKGTP